MGLRQRIAAKLYGRMVNRVYARRAPDFIIGTSDSPYLQRWFLIPRNPILNVYLHRFLRSDDDRALHDHPWANISFLLYGTYVEHTIPQGGINVRKQYRAGDIKFRSAKAAHRIEIIDGPAWSLFITGPRLRNWGFHCPAGWKRWQDFTKPGASGEVGPGCDDGDPRFVRRESVSRGGSL